MQENNILTAQVCNENQINQISWGWGKPTWTSSLRTTFTGRAETRPSKAEKQSIKVNEFQLCWGSGLFICDASIQERTTFLNKGRSCLTINFSPRRAPIYQRDPSISNRFNIIATKQRKFSKKDRELDYLF